MSPTPAESDHLRALRDGLAGLARSHVLANGDPADLAQATVELAESVLATLCARDPPARPLACVKGCAACCHVRVSLTVPEALLIARHLRRGASDLIRSLRDHVARLDALPADDYFLTALACPFLSDNMCAIHPVRPLMCRRANSVDATQCHRIIFNRMLGEITGYRHQGEVVDAASRGLARGITAAGRDGTTLELTAAVLAALVDPEIEGRWRSRAPAFVEAGAALRAGTV